MNFSKKKSCTRHKCLNLEILIIQENSFKRYKNTCRVSSVLTRNGLFLNIQLTPVAVKITCFLLVCFLTLIDSSCERTLIERYSRWRSFIDPNCSEVGTEVQFGTAKFPELTQVNKC